MKEEPPSGRPTTDHPSTKLEAGGPRTTGRRIAKALIVIVILAAIGGAAYLFWTKSGFRLPLRGRSVRSALSKAVSATTGGQADWLVMVYLDGDNNLDPFAIEDVMEMEQVGSSDAVRIVVLLDRSASADWTTARRFLVRRRGEAPAPGPSPGPGCEAVVHSEELKDLPSWDPRLPTCEDIGEVNMGDPDTLAGFVEWARAEYPADRNMLVIWNHGGGWRDVFAKAVGIGDAQDKAAERKAAIRRLVKGIAWDDTSDGDFLESREVRQALEKSPKLTVLGADACLMAMIEVAYEWREQAEYFVGSEELEPGDGWPYDTILRDLSADPSMDGRTLAARIVQLYGESYESAQGTTQSAVDLSKLQPLAQGMDKLAGSFLQTGAAKGGSADTASAPSLPGTRRAGFLDLDKFLDDIESDADFSAEIRQTARDTRAQFAQALVANHSDAGSVMRGLTIYGDIEHVDSDYNADIIRFARDTRWDELLRAVEGQAEEAGASPARPAFKRWAVLIGVEEYIDPGIPKLAYAKDDVELLRSVLVAEAGYEPGNVLTLVDSEASVEKVRSALGTWLPRQAAENDMVMIYFSGHGGAEPSASGASEDGTEKYMMLVDSRLEDMYGTALPMPELGRIFRRIRADKLVFAMDACYSGAAGSRGVMRRGMKATGLSDAYLEALAGSQGTVVLTASGATEISMESADLGHGIFTYYLCQALKGEADFDGDGMTTVVEAYQYLSTQVPAEAKKQGASQHPVMRGKLAGSFPFAGSTERKPTAGERRPVAETHAVKREINHKKEILNAKHRALEKVQALAATDPRRREVEKLNEGRDPSDMTWIAGITPLTGMPSEKRKEYLGLKEGPEVLPLELDLPEAKVKMPSRLDWRERNGVASLVENQGGCGSCWAFAALELVESQALIEGMGEFNLSEQHLVSCDPYDAGCSGGHPVYTLRFLKSAGCVKESCFPYVASDDVACDEHACDVAVRVIDGAVGRPADMDWLVKLCLYVYGPVYTTLHATDEFQVYDGGVFDEDVSDESVNHAILLVGWNDDLGAWLIKNSWGTDWGIGGYGWVKYGCLNINKIICLMAVEKPSDEPSEEARR